MNEENVPYKCNGVLFSLKKKKRDPVIRDDMDETEKHYAKRNKVDRERQILHSITFMWYL